MAWAVVAVALILAPSLAGARTLHVPAQYPTVQSALDAAVDGDEVIVSPGKYLEYPHFNGRDVVLRSEDPTSPSVVAATILARETGLYAAIVTFAGTEGTTCVLSGFTITGGGGHDGGGIWGNGTKATICYNVINDNFAEGDGGGIAMCNGWIHHNRILENRAGARGGGWRSATV